jgi:hypothetical protein
MELNEKARAALSKEIAGCVALLPGKPPERAMVHIEDGCNIYRGGEKAICAFVHTVFQEPLEAGSQKAYIEAMYALLREELGLDFKQVYFAMAGVDVWGSSGTIRQADPS